MFAVVDEGNARFVVVAFCAYTVKELTASAEIEA